MWPKLLYIKAYWPPTQVVQLWSEPCSRRHRSTPSATDMISYANRRIMSVYMVPGEKAKMPLTHRHRLRQAGWKKLRPAVDWIWGI